MFPVLLFVLLAYAIATPLQPAMKGDVWTTVCCEENDLNKNGGISFREFTPFVLNLMNLNRAELEKLFLAGDIDRNSELDGDECIPMRNILKSTLREKSELLLKKYDRNGDRNLSKEEADSLAKKEFGVTSDDLFALSDQNRDQVINAGDEMTNLMMSLQSRALSNGTATLSTFDANGDGKVSYEEIKQDIVRTTDGFTLKQVFKTIDFDKDFYLTADEYLALLNELEIRQKEGNRSVTPKTIEMSESTATARTIRRERVTSAEESVDNAKSSSTSSSESPTVSDSPALAEDREAAATTQSSTDESSGTSVGDIKESSSVAISTSEAPSVTDTHIRNERSVEKGSSPASLVSESSTIASNETVHETTPEVTSKSSPAVRTVVNIKVIDVMSEDSSNSSSAHIESSNSTTMSEKLLLQDNSTDLSASSSTESSKKNVTVIDLASSAARKLTAVQSRARRAVEKESPKSSFLNSSSAEDDERILGANSTLVDVARVRDRRNADKEMIKVPASRMIHEMSMDEEPAVEEKALGSAKASARSRMSPERRRRYFGSVSRRTKREKIETLETAPPVIASEELPKELMAKISQKAASHHGGIVKPSIPESVTIPYDSKEVH